MDNNWKNRFSAFEKFLNILESLNPTNIPVQAVLVILNRKPGLKDTNFQVAMIRLKIVLYVAQHCVFSDVCVDCVINDVIDRLGDLKNGALAADVLTAMAEGTNFNRIAVTVATFATTQKSPKVFLESLLWLSNAVMEFGFE